MRVSDVESWSLPCKKLTSGTQHSQADCFAAQAYNIFLGTITVTDTITVATWPAPPGGGHHLLYFDHSCLV